MDDDLDRIRRQFEAEQRAADEARARRQAEKEREAAYEAAWGEVLREFRRLDLDPEAEANLAPLEHLASQLKAWERTQWLIEMAANFQHQLNSGRDTPVGSRRPELWFVSILLRLSESPPNRDQAAALLTEFRRRGFCPFGMFEIADSVMDYVRDHLAAMQQIRKQRLAEILERSGPVVAALSKRKPAIQRNLTFAMWVDDEKLKPSEIRDRWIATNPKARLGKGTVGIDRVKKGIQAARAFLDELAACAHPLSAKQALELLLKTMPD